MCDFHCVKFCLKAFKNSELLGAFKLEFLFPNCYLFCVLQLCNNRAFMQNKVLGYKVCDLTYSNSQDSYNLLDLISNTL